MVLDFTRIRELEQAVARAQQRLDTAATTTERWNAQAALAEARAALAAVWTAHYAEIKVTADALLAATRTSDVLGLFPVALEAKLEPAQRRLRVRVWPDPIVQSLHDPALTAGERAAGQRYWTAFAAATIETERQEAWRMLATELDAQRAAWVAHVLTPTNVGALSARTAPIFPTVTLEDPANPFVPNAALLPDRWIVVGYCDKGQTIFHVGSRIAQPLVTGLDVRPGLVEQLRNADGAPVQLPASMRWMADFDTAVAAGMAMEIPVPSDLQQIDQLLAFGIRGGGAAAGGNELERLLTGHRYGRGLAFVPQETPTNNSPAGASGLPKPDVAITRAYSLERKPRSYSAALESNGSRAASALGVDPEIFSATPFSGATAKVHLEPDGFEPEIARAMQTVLWMPVLGHFLEDLVGVDPGRLEALRNHFLDNVSAPGPVPAIRIGDQPYGILPVTAIHAFKSNAPDEIDPTLIELIRVAPRFLENISLDDTSLATKLMFCGRPRTLLEAEEAPRAEEHTRWRDVAAYIARITDGAIPDTWAGGPLGTLGGERISLPAPFTELPPQSLADESTASVLIALANDRVDAVKASAPPSSVVARMARHATLLEWARLGGAVAESALQGTPFLEEARSAAARDRSLWIDLLLHAFGLISAPPFPVDEVAVAKIVALVGSLDKPRRGCPGQARWTKFRAALRVLAQVPAPKLDAFAHATLWLSTVRADAWQTSLATSRLRALREVAPLGLVVGGFGWLHDVRAAELLPPLHAEFIHAPSNDHAAAAAVLRSAALRAGSASSAHADIDLSSRRVRLAKWLVEGTKSGRSLQELLGARFERRLVEAGGGALLPQLRRQFAGGTASGILDGLALHAAPPTINSQAFALALADLRDAFDSLADALTAESVYQCIRGNPAGALLTVDDVARGTTPPELQVTESPKVGARIAHRIAAVIPHGQRAPGWPSVHTPRADADPLLDAWCGHVLGPAAATTLTVVGDGGAAASIGLDRLRIAAIDVVVAAAANGGAELEQRLLARARALQTRSVAATVRHDTTWKDLLRLCSRMAALIGQAEPLATDALALPDTASTQSNPEQDLPKRAAAARRRLEALRDNLNSANMAAGVVLDAAAFGVILPGAELDAAPTPSDVKALQAAVQGRLAAAAARTEPRDQLKALLGEGILGLVPVRPPDPSVLWAATASPQSTLGIDASVCASWLETMAYVRPALTRLTDVMAMSEISGRSVAPPLRVAQAPLTAGDPWVGVGSTNATTRAPVQARLSIVLHAPAGIDPTTPLGGFLVDAWAEAVPPPHRDTALAIHHNGPNTRAPQAVLLAVAPDTTLPAWTTDMLLESIWDLVDAMLLRQGVLFLAPSTIYLGRRGDGKGISYDMAASSA